MSLYDYRVRRVLRVVDGDTVDLELDLGFYMSAALRFRLLGVDTPERGQAGWAEAGTYVRQWLDQALDPAAGIDLRARTAKADSFGRWLADVVPIAAGVVLNSLTDDLITAGHGTPYPR